MSRSVSLLRGTARWVRRFALVLTGAVLLALIGLLTWARMILPAERSARFSLDSDEAVLVSRDEWVSFRPRDADPETGVIFYPGARVEPAAYAPILHDLAARGFIVVMTPMPLNLAILAPEQAGRVMARFGDVRRWILAGHSLGGVAAAEFAEQHEGDLAGLMLWASYPAAFSDLSKSNIPVLSIYATADALTTPAEIEQSRRRLPAGVSFVAIQGGDHWGFGNFAPGKGTATISRDSQQAQILEATQSFLEHHE